MADIIHARNVTVMLGGMKVLDSVDFVVGNREIVAVLGENGAGKSTLLRCMAGLQHNIGGVLTVLDRPPRDEPEFWRDIVLVGDEPAWYPGVTVAEHLHMLSSVHGRSRMRPEEALDLFGLTGRRDVSPLSMSTGQRQRLSLAMALSRPSRVLLLDEPERGLDAEFRTWMASVLAAYAEAGGTVVMATHAPDMAEAAGARLVTLETG